MSNLKEAMSADREYRELADRYQVEPDEAQREEQVSAETAMKTDVRKEGAGLEKLKRWVHKRRRSVNMDAR